MLFFCFFTGRELNENEGTLVTLQKFNTGVYITVLVHTAILPLLESTHAGEAYGGLWKLVVAQ